MSSKTGRDENSMLRCSTLIIQLCTIYEFTMYDLSRVYRGSVAGRLCGSERVGGVGIGVQLLVNGVFADELGYDMLHLPHGGEDFVLVGDGYQLVDFGTDGVKIVLAHARNHYLLVVGGQGGLFLVEQLLVEFLARAQPREGDLYVLARGESREAYHVLRQIGDFDGVPHVENKDFTAVSERCRLHDEGAGFGDGHEVADDVGVRHRDGSARGNLLLEIGNDGAVAAEHVAEARGDELGGAGVAGVQFVEQRLHVDFGDTLAGTHDVGGVDRLVGGYHHEALRAVFHRHVSHVLGAHDVGLNRLVGVALHEGHVLVGGGVEDYVGAEIAEDLLHALAVADITDEGYETNVGEVVAEVEGDVVQGRLRLLEEDDGFGLVLGDLAHQLAADTACGTAHEGDFAADDLADVVGVDFDGRALQQVLHADSLNASDVLCQILSSSSSSSSSRLYEYIQEYKSIRV